MRTMRAVMVVLVCALASIATTADAQYHGDDGDDPISGELAGAMRFHVDVPLFRFAAITSTREAGGMSTDSTRTATSIGNGVDLSSSLLGRLNLGFGYAATDAIVVGATVQVGYDTVSLEDVPDADESFLSLGFAPYFEYLGGDGGTKPFIGATAYVRHVANTEKDSGVEETDSITMFGGGLLGGAHFFMSKGCSIDLTGRVTYGIGNGPDLGSAVDTSTSALEVLASVGVSAWIL